MATPLELIGQLIRQNGLGPDDLPYIQHAVSTGYYRLTEEGGKVGITVGGKFFTDIEEAAQWRAATEHRRDDVIQRMPGDSSYLRSAPRDTGVFQYRRLESSARQMEKVAPDQFLRDHGISSLQGIKFTRTSHGIGGRIEDVVDSMVRNDQMYGYVIPDDETMTVIRGFVGGRELTREELEHAHNLIGESIMIRPGDKTRTDLVKLMKRLKVRANLEEYEGAFDSPFKALIYDSDEALVGGMRGSMFNPNNKRAFSQLGAALKAEGKEDDWEKLSSGISYMNPQAVHKLADQMEAELKLRQKDFTENMTGLDNADRRFYEQLLEKEKDSIKELRRLANDGGRAQDLRIFGFDRDWLLKAGLTPEQADEFSRQMAKGDALIPADWKEFAKRMESATGGRMSYDDIMATDLVTGKASLTSQYGGTKGGRLSLKATETHGYLRADPQFLAGYGKELFDAGNDFARFKETNSAAFRQALDDMLTTGELPPGYREHMQKILGITAGEDTDAIAELLGLSKSMKPEDLIAELRHQQGRASMLLSYEKMGLNPATDQKMFGELAQGLSDFMNKEKFGPKKGYLHGFVEGGAQGHVMSDVQAQLLGVKQGMDLKSGQIGFSSKYGFIYQGQDFVNFGATAHGGADFDDLLGTILHWDEEQSRFVAVVKRSPGGLGEIAMLEMNDASLEDYARAITTDGRVAVPQNSTLKKALEGVGFYDKNWESLDKAYRSASVKNALRDHLPKLNEETRSSLTRLGYTVPSPGQYMAPDLSTVGVKHRTDADLRAWINNNAEQAEQLQGKTAAQLYEDQKWWQDLDDVGRTEISEAFRHRAGKGVLGKYSLAREFTDTLARQMEVTRHVAGTNFEMMPMEPVIDLMVQGLASEYEGLTTGHVELAGQELMKAWATAIKDHGIKLDRGALTVRNAASVDQFLDLLHEQEGMEDVKLEDILMDSTDKNAVISRSLRAQEELQAQRTLDIAERSAKLGRDPAIMRQFFDDKAMNDAEAMRKAWEDTHTMWRQGQLGLSEAQQHMRYGDMLIDTTDPAFAAGKAREEMRRVFASYFEKDGTMGRRAEQAMGAFMQQYGDTEYGRALAGGELADASAVVRARFAGRGIGASRFTAEEIANSKSYGTKEITKTQMLFGIGEDYITPGAKAAERGGAAYRAARDVLGPQGTKIGEAVSKLWKVPTFRKGAIAGAGLVAASLLYQRSKDRTTDDMAGPPLLPGGSFYEQNQSDPMPPIAQPQQQQQGSGVVYKVNSRGKFSHHAFKALAQTIVGAPASATVMKALATAKPSDPRNASLGG